MLYGRNILVGISGSIAAYKSAFLIRLLVKAGANVKVIMTPAAKDFITPLTLSTLSKNTVYSEFSKPDGSWVNHVDLALWADDIIIAPASANTIAKMAHGLSDNLLMAVYLSAKCTVCVAPAMDLDMYKHPSTKENFKKLAAFGVKVIPPGTGELASGLLGEGRMAEPEDIIRFIDEQKLLLHKKKVLVTAGPTYEAIDPVRFIGNHSSGKMGFAIAEEFAKNGADVTLVTGPVALQQQHPTIKRIDVTSADEMFKACTTNFKNKDIVVMAAAVADYKPLVVAKQKIKKASETFTIPLSRNKDILMELGKMKSNKQILVGFALETENELANAKEKMKKKNLDIIVLNSLQDKGAGFKNDTNKITLIDKYNKTTTFELKSKTEVAKDIVQKIIFLQAHNHA
ncbi:MAG: bifunctional phosphopantothenoylcysteine decarboxylase/phosphopantothenate--cysteine ligase CoaBC [Bacteroidia bacterium]